MARPAKKDSDPIRDGIVHGLDKAHRVADLVLTPVKPLDSAIHGVAIGVSNWLMDRHPDEDPCHKAHPCNNNTTPSPPPANTCDNTTTPPPGGNGGINSGPGGNKFGPVSNNNLSGAASNNSGNVRIG